MHVRTVEKPSAALVIITDLKLFTVVSNLMRVTIIRKSLGDSLGIRVEPFHWIETFRM